MLHSIFRPMDSEVRNCFLFRSLKFSYHTRRQPQTLAEAKQVKKPRKRNVSDDYPSVMLEKGEKRGSPAINIPNMARSSSSEDLSSSVGCYPIISMYLIYIDCVSCNVCVKLYYCDFGDIYINTWFCLVTAQYIFEFCINEFLSAMQLFANLKM